MDYKIVMDSAGDLTGLEGCKFDSAALTIQTKDRVFVDDSSINVLEMVEFLREYKGKASTACPGVGEYLEKFGNAENVFCVTITSGLSGSYNSAKIAADTYMEQFPDRKVHVFDSLSAGPEMALIATKISEIVKENLSFEAIVDQVNEYKNNTHLLFCLESLHNLANNGRISPAVSKIAGILGMRIIGKASDEGQLQLVNKVRGEKKIIGAIITEMQKLGYSGGKVRITHCFNEAVALSLKNSIIERFEKANVFVSKARALCSFYAERGGLLIGFEV